MRPDGRARPKVLLAAGPVIGGTLTHLDYVLAYTDPAEFEVHLAVSSLHHPSVRARLDEWRKAGWTVHDMPMHREVNPYRDAAAFRRLARLCLRERFDLVHTHCAKAGLLGRAAARLSGAGTVHTPHVFPFGREGAAPEALYLALEQMAAGWTDRLVLLSRYQVNLVVRHKLIPLERTVLIPNGIDPERFEGSSRRVAREALGIGQDEPVALALGRVCEQKGLNVLLDAMGSLKGRGLHLRLFIVGSGDLEARLGRRLERLGLAPWVMMVGMTEAVQPYYAACDLVLLPSRFEGMPYVILEAKAAARPVAVSLVSGMEEFVRHAEDGFLVRPGDAEAWAQVLAFMVKRPEALRCAGRCARGSLRPEWHARHCVGRLQALYRELLAERKERSPAAPPGDRRI